MLPWATCFVLETVGGSQKQQLPHAKESIRSAWSAGNWPHDSTRSNLVGIRICLMKNASASNRGRLRRTMDFIFSLAVNRQRLH
jgi:hypothetical protein